MMGEQAKWQWFAGSTEEYFSIGPMASREEVIAEGRALFGGDAFFICEATQPPLIKLSDWFDVVRALEDAEESVSDSDRVCYEFDEPPYFEITPEQRKDLEARIKKAMDEWQAAHGLVFKVSTFANSRNHEMIEGLPEEVSQ